MDGRTGPISNNLTSELESLKHLLAGMSPDELTGEQTAALGVEIGAIRLQLKRLAGEQAVLAEKLRRRALES